MFQTRLMIPVLAITMVLAACGQDPPPPPQPVGPTAEELEQMRQDSIRAAREAEEARRRAEEEARLRAEAEAARERAIAAARATLQEAVYFDYDESAIRADAEQSLRAKLEILRANPSLRVRIEGHADERGSTEYNLALGTRRAEAVRQFFTSFGIDAGRFAITSYGEERPAAQGSDEQAWARNRRAEFVITAGTINPGS
ncbi:MAG: peptidoglycan-associated lipoprotein Pal [Longimicrobiales bacterium]|nr:peptidoglycan-associated lipoprotein Pal [Longimicrobiales bacterium]